MLRIALGIAYEPRRVPRDVTFELKLKVKGPPVLVAGNHTFTESLILAQDERWRRA